MSRPDLPEQRNPLVEPEHTPQREILVERRRLGQTELTVNAGQIGTSNATKPDNLGMFDYAHLRVPLPKDLKGSAIFHASRNHTYPEAYFLMRRSTDGFISATGMFKAAFPWASAEAEETEKKHIKLLPDTGREEVAGNVWIPPTVALDLADEYGMRDWILALLDPEPIPKGTADPSKHIKSPPHFKTDSLANGASQPAPSASGKMSTRGSRSMRSVSPSKAPPTPSRKIATPRRTRRGRGTATSSGLATTAEGVEDDRLSPSAEPEAANDSSAPETIKVDIESTTSPDPDGGAPTTTTHVTVETPASHPELALPNDAQAYLDQAQAAIQAANNLTAGRAGGRKRKADEMLVNDDDEAEGEAGEDGEQQMELQPAKRVRFAEMELRKEKIKRRATLGIAASLAIGAMLPVVMSTFFQAL